MTSKILNQKVAKFYFDLIISLFQHVRIFKDKPLYTLIDHNNDDESIWPKPDRLGRLIRGFKQAHVIFEKVVGMKSAIQEITSNPNRIWLLSTTEQPVVNIGLRKVSLL